MTPYEIAIQRAERIRDKHPKDAGDVYRESEARLIASLIHEAENDVAKITTLRDGIQQVIGVFSDESFNDARAVLTYLRSHGFDVVKKL